MDVRTSLTHPLRIDELPLRATPGLLGITFCPGKRAPGLNGVLWQRDLAADLDVVAAWGAAAVLTLLEAHELQALGVPDLGARVRERGMAWHHCPIADGQVPAAAFAATWAVAGPAVCALLAGGARVLVHCKGGQGRAGTVAACLLIEFGHSPGAAVQAVRRARAGAIETTAQERFVLAQRRRFTIASAPGAAGRVPGAPRDQKP